MDSKRLKKIEKIYHAVLTVQPAEREQFLKKRCGADEDLRREIESLLFFENTPDDLLDTSPESFAAEIFSENGNSIDLTGKTIGHYEIKQLLGRGGMGEVFLAEDVKLNRPVALKCLPPEFAENKARMNRFIREAKSASALNHPNIITIHEINEFEGIHFIATEYIDGKTLKEYLKSESLSVNSVLEIAVQIASALDEAHLAGIIHRDIKPDNVMIRPNGLVKILDFGIAKLPEMPNEENETPIQSPNDSHSAFRVSLLTNPGAVIGTANYMSPEQARGQEIDARTDIFSFGVVLYEMLSGKLPFAGETPSAIIAAIVQTDAPPLDDEKVPFEIKKLIEKCLKKNRDERYQTVTEILNDLKIAKQHPAAEEKNRQTLFSANQTNANTDNPQIETIDKTGQKTSETIGKKSFLKNATAIFLLLTFISAAVFFVYEYFTNKNQIRSIAVMPVVNESGNADFEYLSDGITETLIKRLSDIPDLSVKARSTVFYYKNKKPSPKQIGQELGVDAVLFGHLIRKGNDLKLNLELVDTATQNILWSENYERKLNDLVFLQSEIARDVSEKLSLKLTTAERNQITKNYTTNSQAHQLYLRGRFHWNKRNSKDFEKAAEYFKQAIEKDNSYALAYAGLADTYALMPLYGNFKPNEYKPMAKQSALKALELDAGLAEAHASLGYIFNTYDFDWNLAESEYRKAIELNPNYATAHQWYAEHLAFRGKTDEALEEISKALELDPFSVVINRMKGNILGFAKRHDEAIVQLNKTLELYPENSFVRYNLGDAYAAKKMYAEAVGQYLIALRSDGEKTELIEELEAAFKDKGWKGFWTAYLEHLLQQEKILLEKDKIAYFNGEGIAFAYAVTGNKEKTLEYLTKAFEERDPGLVTIGTSEVYDFLKDDPRYRKLIQNIGLPE